MSLPALPPLLYPPLSVLPRLFLKGLVLFVRVLLLSSSPGVLPLTGRACINGPSNANAFWSKRNSNFRRVFAISNNNSTAKRRSRPSPRILWRLAAHRPPRLLGQLRRGHAANS